MTSFKTVGNTKLSTLFRGVARFGTLCGVLAIVALTAGCPFQPDPCRGFNVNDNNPCTTDTCELDADGAATPVHTAIANCCDAASDCNDNDVCTTDSCANINTTTGRGTCAQADVTGCCNVDADCDVAASEVCDGNACVPGCTSDGDCADGEVCNTTTGQCDPAPGCTDDAGCDDGDACTTDTCDVATGVCSNDAVVCADGEVCAGGTCVTACVADADCVDDGDLCTTETCVGGGCASETNTCDDDVACTDDACDPATGDCSHTDNCVDGTCDLTAGTCTLCETNADCNDDDDCTTDTCTDGACSNTNNTSACNDGNACTTGDICAAGTCAGTTVVCPSGQVCNTTTGNCQVSTCTTNANCNDNASCTADTCNVGTGLCVFTAIDTTCDDGLFCNGTEGAGSCAPDNADAEAATGCVRPGDPCANPTPVCNEATNGCQACTTNAECNDGFSCTSDTCTVLTGVCNNTNSSALCPDPVKCDGDDICDPLNVDADATTGCYAPGNPCAPKVCNETTFVVGDLNTCTNCVSNADCSDGIVCTQDTCNGVTGDCTITNTNSLCPDALFCNGDDICAPADPDAGADGCVNGLPVYPCANACNENTNTCFACTANVECSDGIACTTDTCNGGTGGCTHADNCAVGLCNLQNGQCE